MSTYSPKIFNQLTFVIERLLFSHLGLDLQHQIHVEYLMYFGLKEHNSIYGTTCI